MEDEFPDSVSAVSSVTCEYGAATTVVIPTLTSSSTDKKPLPQKFYEYTAPTTRSILLKAAPEIFESLFPRFRCSTLLCRELTPREGQGAEPDVPKSEILWNLPFLYEQDGIPRNGVMAFVSDHRKTYFDPFRSSPQPDRPCGIDFIKLELVDFRHEFRRFADLLELAGMEELHMRRKNDLRVTELCKTE